MKDKILYIIVFSSILDKTNREKESLVIPRQRYLSRIIPFIDKDVIKVLVGMRRSGKSTLLEEVQTVLLSRGVPPENIIALNFESMRWGQAAASPEAFYQEVMALANHLEGRVYLFFDEIQTVEHWERPVNSFRVDLDCDIYLTGSNSTLLSSELATLIAGRYVSFEVQPFSLRELVDATELNPAEAFEAYRVLGGLPFLSHVSYDRDTSVSYLRDVFNSIVLKDVVQHRNFRDADQLERILAYFLSEIGTTYSVDNIVNMLKQERRRLSNDTVYNYLQAAEEAFLISRVRRFDIKGKALLRGSEKVYVTDIGLREALLGTNASRVDLVLENLVFNELRRRGYTVHVGKLGTREIDFVAERDGGRLYIQVAYLLELESTREREFSAFDGIADGYPRLVVSADTADWSRNGCRHWNIIDFLLADAW
nr:ATP-binding protein [Adlercreutzia sp. JBNU-10]